MLQKRGAVLVREGEGERGVDDGQPRSEEGLAQGKEARDCVVVRGVEEVLRLHSGYGGIESKRDIINPAV